jgi:ribosome-associated protein
MKEVEKNEIKRLSDRLDAIRHQQADLSLVEAADKYAELEKEKPPSKPKLFACAKFRARN